MNINNILKSPLLPISLFGFVVYLLSKKSTNLPLSTSSQIDDLINNDDLVKTSIEKGNYKSYNNETFISFADKLHTALNKSNVDEPKVFQILNKINNDTDFIILNRTFGVRELDIFWRTSWSSQNLTMKQMLSKQMDTNEKNTINTDFSNKGLTFSIYNIK